MLQIVLKGIQYNCQVIKRAQTQDNDSSYQEINRCLESINKMTALAYKLGCHEQAHKIVRETLNVQAD